MQVNRPSGMEVNNANQLVVLRGNHWPTDSYFGQHEGWVMEIWEALAVLAGWALTFGVFVYLVVRWTIVVLAVLVFLLMDWVVWTSSLAVWHQIVIGGVIA